MIDASELQEVMDLGTGEITLAVAALCFSKMKHTKREDYYTGLGYENAQMMEIKDALDYIMKHSSTIENGMRRG